MQTAPARTSLEEWLQNGLSFSDCWVLASGLEPANTLGLLHRVRGALGRVLAESASQQALDGEPCPFDPPCAYDVFHNCQGNLDGRELPKPFVLRVDPEPSGIRVILRLFGRATSWRHGLSQALVAAIRRDLGGQSGIVLDSGIVGGVFQGAIAEIKTVTLATPLILRSRSLAQVKAGATVGSEGVVPSLIQSLALRAQGLAAWCGVDALDSYPDGLPTVDGRLITTRITRGPGRARLGLTGRLRFGALDDRHRALLHFGACAHAGADTVIGAGRLNIGG